MKRDSRSPSNDAGPAQAESARRVANVIVTGGRAFVALLTQENDGCPGVREINPEMAALAVALADSLQGGPGQCLSAQAPAAASKLDPRLAAAGLRSWEELARQGAFYLVYRDLQSLHLDVSQHFQARRRRNEKAFILPDKARSQILPAATPLEEIARLILEDARSRPEAWRREPAAAGEAPPGRERVRPWPVLAYRAMLAAFWVEDLLGGPRRRLAQIPLRAGLTVVDYACGPGRYTIPVAESVGPEGRVYAVDSQPLALEIVEQKASQARLTNLTTVLVDSFDTGLPGGSADLVLLIDAITPITQRASLLSEVHRLLKPEGQLFMDASHMSPEKARDIVAETGLFSLLKTDGRTMLWRRAEGA